MYFLIGIAIALGVSFFGGVILAIITTDEGGTPKSILYDDPEYFEHSEPDWIKKEEEE